MIDDGGDGGLLELQGICQLLPVNFSPRLRLCSETNTLQIFLAGCDFRIGVRLSLFGTNCVVEDMCVSKDMQAVQQMLCS